MEDGFVLDLNVNREEAEPQSNPMAIEGSSWYFKDGDTLGNSDTGESMRFRGIDTRETAKFLEESGFTEGELGGDASTAYFWNLANKHGFNQVVMTGEKGKHGRSIGDLQNANGESFVDTLLKTGVAKLSTFSDGDDFENAMWGAVTRENRPLGEPLSDYENARQAINEIETEQYGGLPIEKLMAFDAAEFAANPDIYMGIKTRLAGADYAGRSRTPFGTGFDTGFANLYKGLNVFGQAISNRFGAEGMEASFAADAAVNQDYINAQPTVKMDVTEIDWTSFDEVTDGMMGMLGTSVPFMGATMVGMAAAAPTGGASLTLPVAVYTGMVLDTMEGDIADKNLALAVVAGAGMTFLDRLGLKGLVSPAMMITKEGRNEAIKAIAKNKGISEAEASKLLLQFSKKELLTYVDDAKAFGATQIQRGHLFRESVKRLSQSSAGEGVTEALQEITEYAAAVIGSEKEWDYDEIQNRMTNALVAGGLMGAGFATPGVAYQVGDWKAAADFESTDDGRFDNKNTHIRKEEETKYGTKRTLSDLADINHEYERNAPADDTVEHVDDLAEKHVAPETTVEYIKAFVNNPMVMLRAAVSNTANKADGNSKSLVKIVEMMGSMRDRVWGGAGMVQEQQIRMAEYNTILRDHETIEASFNTPRGLSSIGRSEYVSSLATKFYREVLQPATKGKRSMDWSKASPEVLANKEALLELNAEFTSLSDTLLNDNNKAKDYDGEAHTGRIPDWAYRHKGFRTEYIASNKEAFTSTLMKSYGMTHAEASALTDAITSNEGVSTLSDAFDITKGGVSPSSQKARKMHISDRPEFDKFLEQNIFKNMSDASREAARFQAHRKFIGKDSKYLNRMLADVKRELHAKMPPVEADKLLNEVAYDLRNLLNAESGNYNRIQNETLKQGQKYLTLLAALQGLANAAFSSMPEMSMIPHGVPREVLVKNSATQGYLFGSAVGAWMRNLAVTARVAKPRDDINTFLDKRLAEVRSKGNTDPRFMFYTNMKEMLKQTGFTSQETGAATTTGVQETNEMTRGLTDSFFKANFLHDQQDMHRMMRLSFFNDFLIGKLDLIESKKGQPDTVGVAEAKHMLRELGIPLSVIQPIAIKLKNGEALSDSDKIKYKREFLNGAANFVNQAIPLPNALNRPLFYSDSHFALLTQFNGFTSTFTANQLPMLWDQLKGKSTSGLTYGTFATMGGMLALAFISQGIKDELKYGETSPYLTDAQKIQRAIYSSGLLGTTERVIGSNFLLPLYDSSSHGAGEFVWDNMASEAAATGVIEKAYGMVSGAAEGDSEKFRKNAIKSVPFAGPYWHQIDKAIEEWK